MNPSPVEVILGEDNPADARLIGLCLEGLRDPLSAQCYPSGRKLVQYLEARPASAGPMILFLDFFLREIEGPKVLSWLRQQPQFANTPVIMMSGSYLEEVMVRSYEFGGNYFLEKSTDPDKFFAEIKGILGYLLKVNAAREPA